MKPFLLVGVVLVTIPVALSLVLTIIMLMVLNGLWNTRSYWVPRVMYHGITLIAGYIGLWVAYETYYAPRKSVAGVMDLIFFVTAELAMAGVLLWWHHQSWMVQAAEMWFFDRRHERHQREDLAFDLRRSS